MANILGKGISSPEIGFRLELIEIQADQLSTKFCRDKRSQRCVTDDGHEELRVDADNTKQDIGVSESE